MARSRRTVESDTDDLDQIERWYRRQLEAPAEVRPVKWEPVKIGPTWQMDGRHWLLPERTLGWAMLAWTGRWLQHGPLVPWRWTLEQARFLLWWYAAEESCAFTYRDGVLQRLKGWGKDPIGAGLGAFEQNGPARIVDMVAGQPIGGPVEEAWIQTAAVSLEQTKNTMRLFPGLYTAEAISRFGLQIGKEQIFSDNGRRFLQAVTSSPATLEGARSTFVLLNETHHWNSSNGGHDMAAVIERNATKSADGAARTLRITNAFEPGRDSVAERDRDAYESVLAETSAPAGLLYDSLEAPPEAPLTLEVAPEVVESIRGVSTWLDVDRIVQSIADKRNPPSRSRRFWYNQITAAEDAWLVPADVDAVESSLLSVVRGETITAFFDGSKSDDTTGIVGCRVTDGAVFKLGAWSKPPDTRGGKEWIVPRSEVDQRVSEIFEKFDVLAFWADPSHAKDDEDGERFWDDTIDGWHQRYAKKINKKFWATRSGDSQSAFMWDMTSPERQAIFTAATERFSTELEARATAIREGDADQDGVLPDGLFVADELLKQHLKNARRRPNKHGVGIGKEHRESAKKIDLAVCAVGARMLRRLVTNMQSSERQRSGKVW